MQRFGFALLGGVFLILSSCASGDIDLDVTDTTIGSLNADGTTAPVTITVKEKEGQCDAKNVKITFASTTMDFGKVKAGKSKTLTQNIPADEIENGSLSGKKGDCNSARL